MYIADMYWNNYIGDTDDSLTLTDYLAEKQKDPLPLQEIFADTGLDKLGWDFRKTDPCLIYKDQAGGEHEFYYAIDLVTDLAALMLECKMSGQIDLCELSGDDLDTAVSEIHITATPEDRERMNKALMDFVSAPLDYDLSEMCPEEDMLEMAGICESLRKELFG